MSSSPTPPPEPTGPTRRGKWILAGIAVAVVLIVGVIVAVVVSSSDSDSSATAPKVLSAKVGEPAPDFELPTLDGKTVKLSEYEGKPLVLNFWASWCNPCRREFPMFREELANANGKWALVGVDTQDFVKSDGRDFAEKERATWPNGYDSDGAVKAAYSGSPGLPQTFFIDKKGVIRAHLFGELTADSLQEELQKLGVS